MNLLEQHFGDLVDYSYTARMEDDLDEIAARHVEREPWLRRFWFGQEDNGAAGLKVMVDRGLDEIGAAAINTIPLGVDEAGNVIVVKPGRYGPYVKRGDDTASVPDDVAPDEMTVDKAIELLSAPRGDRELGVDPASGLTVFVKPGRYGPYVQLGEMAGGPRTSRTSSLFKTMDPESISLDDALRLLSLPRVVGSDPESGEEITAQNGRYGPYLRKGSDSRSLDDEEQIFSVTVEEALRIYAEPSARGGGSPRRSRSWARTRCPTSRWWSRTVASAHTSPTAR